MRDFLAIFYIEVKRFFSRKNMIAWFIILLLLLFQAHISVKKIQKFPETIQTFKQIQKKYFEGLRNYGVYCDHGIKILFIPSLTNILTCDTIIPSGLTAWVNAVSKVELSCDSKGNSISPVQWTGQLDISTTIAWFISFMALWYGFNSFHCSQYIKFLSNFISHSRAFLYTTLSRLVLFIGIFIFTMILIYTFILWRGIQFSYEDSKGLINFMITSLVMLMVFFLIGVFLGSFKEKPKIYISIIATWILLNFGAFWSIDILLKSYISSSNEYLHSESKKFELSKVIVIRKYQKKIGLFDGEKIEDAQKRIKAYCNHDFKKVQLEENQLKKEIQTKIKTYMNWNLFIPTTFFRLTITENSSCGYLNYINLYDYAQNMQKKFFLFWIDRFYFKDRKVIVNFIQGDEDIFRGKSMLPPHFKLGVMINFGYCIILFFLSYYFYKRKVVKNFEDEIQYDLFESKPMLGENESFNSQVIKTFFSRSKGLKTKIIMNDNNHANNKDSDYFYLPNPEHIPYELNGRHLLFFFKLFIQDPQQVTKKINDEIGKNALNKKFQKLDTDTKARILLTLALNVNANIYIFDSFIDNVTNDARTNLANKIHDEYSKRQTMNTQNSEV